MTDERDVAVTGVARGSLGTGTALDDTQVWDTNELQAEAAAAESVPAAAQVPEPQRDPATGRRARARSEGATLDRYPAPAVKPSAPAAAAVPRAGVAPARRQSASRASAVVVLALLALIGGAAFAAFSRPDAGASVQPSSGTIATSAPTQAPPADGGGGGGGKGNGNGGGNGKGNGNGGNGNGHD